MSEEQPRDPFKSPALGRLLALAAVMGKYGGIEPASNPGGVVIHGCWKTERIFERKVPADHAAMKRDGFQTWDAIDTVGVPRHEIICFLFDGDSGKLQAIGGPGMPFWIWVEPA